MGTEITVVFVAGDLVCPFMAVWAKQDLVVAGSFLLLRPLFPQSWVNRLGLMPFKHAEPLLSRVS